MNRVKIRTIGREQFWSAGRKWNAEGTTVTIVADDPMPEKFRRPVVDGRGCYALVIPDDLEIIPAIDARRVRTFMKNGKPYVRDPEGPPDAEPFEVRTELALPEMDIDIQVWAAGNRMLHMEKGEITIADFGVVRGDHRWLACEYPDMAFTGPEGQPV